MLGFAKVTEKTTPGLNLVLLYMAAIENLGVANIKRKLWSRSYVQVQVLGPVPESQVLGPSPRSQVLGPSPWSWVQVLGPIQSYHIISTPDLNR